MMKRKVIALGLSMILGLGSFATSGYTAFAKEAFKEGMKTQGVLEIQNKLLEKGYLQGDVDGVYGAKTREAITSFQQTKGITADGMAGRVTLAYLGIPAGVLNQVAAIEAAYDVAWSAKADDISVSEDEKILLAKVITGEARGESFEGQVAVGAVVLNRIGNPQFPKTLLDVVYQKNAFTAVKDGQINLEPTPESIKAAEAALNGQDPTRGSLFYWNPKISTCGWIKTRTVVTVIGNHNFGV